MKLAKLDTNVMKLQYMTTIDPKVNNIEKNWPPIEFPTEDKNKFLFSYWVNPHRVLTVLNPHSKETVRVKFKPSLEKIPLQWEKKWGPIGGGTPVRMVDGELVGFFHSKLHDKKINRYYYFMGAYTLETFTPFRIRRISRFPIVFSGIYSIPIVKTADIKKPAQAGIQ